MARFQKSPFFNIHRTWEDYAGLMLGIVVLLSPWMAGQTAHSAAVTSASLTGLALIVVAGLEIMRLYRWHEVATLLMGAWLFLSPFMLGYSQMSPLGPTHILLGSVIGMLASLEMWQDWGLSNEQLSVHGQ